MLVFSTQVPCSVRFYRLWSASATDHFYTADATEAAGAAGYVIEDMLMYIYPTQLCGSVPIYRLYYAAGTDHFYTLSAAERDSAEALGYTYEGIAGYVFEPTGNAANIPYCTSTTSMAAATSIATATTVVTTPTTTTSTSESSTVSTPCSTAAGVPTGYGIGSTSAAGTAFSYADFFS